MVMQLSFLRQSYQMQSDLFDRSVNEALNNVVAKVIKQDAINFLNVKAQHDTGRKSLWNVRIIKQRNSRLAAGDNLLKKSTAKLKRPMTSRQRKIALLHDSLKRMIMHKRLDDELSGLMQDGAVSLQIRTKRLPTNRA